MTNSLVETAQQMVNFQPLNPVQAEQLITEANKLLEQMPDVLLEINERRYEAERAWSKAKNTAMVKHHANKMPVSIARAQAEVDAQPEREVFDRARAEFHYAEDTAKALTTKIYSLLNLNKSVTAAYNSYRGG